MPTARKTPSSSWRSKDSTLESQQGLPSGVAARPASDAAALGPELENMPSGYFPVAE